MPTNVRFGKLRRVFKANCGYERVNYLFNFNNFVGLLGGQMIKLILIWIAVMDTIGIVFGIYGYGSAKGWWD